MRFTIKREEFLKGLNVAARAISSKNAKAVLENFKLDLELSSTSSLVISYEIWDVYVGYLYELSSK